MKRDQTTRENIRNEKKKIQRKPTYSLSYPPYCISK